MQPTPSVANTNLSQDTAHQQLRTSQLSLGGQLFIWGLRQWVVTSKRQHCTLQALSAFYQERSAEAALILDELMCLLGKTAMRTVEIRCVCSRELSDDEVRLLAAARCCQQGLVKESDSVLRGLVYPQVRRTFIRVLGDYATTMTQAGMGLHEAPRFAVASTPA